jgi:hypothetical protein
MIQYQEQKASPGAPFSPVSEGAIMSDEPEIPYVVKADVGRLPDGSYGLRLTLATSEEAYLSKAWQEVAFLIGPATARALAADLG